MTADTATTGAATGGAATGGPASGAAPLAIVHPDAGLLAKATAARLVVALIDAQAARGDASLVLTGGGIGVALLRAVREVPAVDAVDWSRVDVFWGDERFVAPDSPDRNERQAREALLDHLPMDDKRIFPMGFPLGPTAGGDRETTGPGYPDPHTAAAEYTAVLGQLAGTTGACGNGAVPAFDVLLLGLGPEGHVASIFPDSPAVFATEPVVAVENCPKPPPTRISLSLPSIRSAREVWVVTAGEEKTEAAAAALGGADPVKVPAAGARGTERTLWLLDRSAASRLP